MIKERTEREILIEDNLGLVHSCVRKFIDKGVEYDDLFQAGCVGLIKAADGFDKSLGFSFSTYAVPAILGEIRRIFRDGGSVKVGRSLKEKSRKALVQKENLTKALGREPTIGELSEVMNTDVAEAAYIINAAMPTLSLTYDDGEGEENQIDIPVMSPEDEISDVIALREVIGKLDARDRQLITLRYYHKLTQAKTAERLGMSQVQVSRREKIILSVIRKSLI